MTDLEKTTQVLHRALGNISNSIIDNYIQNNVKFRSESGMSAKIIRTSSGNCCKWCNSIAGKYSYPDVPKDVYRRHDNCDCTVEYITGKTRTNVHTKEITNVEIDSETINDKRKMITSIIEDVTEKYKKEAKPGIGNIVIEEGTKEFDIKVTNILFDLFGGNIRCLRDTPNFGKMPDALWNGVYWEYKNPESVKSIYGCIRKARRQISERIRLYNGNENELRGIVIDIGKINENQDIILREIYKETSLQCNHPTDVIVISGNRVIQIIRLHK